MTGLKRTLRSRRGFTLVELVVVLVILGVVAAFAVPALTGYIDSAKEKQAVSEAQACVETATSLGARQYAAAQEKAVEGGDALKNLDGWLADPDAEAPEVGGDIALTDGSGQYILHAETTPEGNLAAGANHLLTDIPTGAGVGGTVSDASFAPSGRLLYLVYTSADGITVVYTNSAAGGSIRVDTDVTAVPAPSSMPVTPAPTRQPADPTTEPSTEPSARPTATPTASPTAPPTAKPTPKPTFDPGKPKLIIHMQDALTKSAGNFRKRTYTFTNGNFSFTAETDENGDIELDLLPQTDTQRAGALVSYQNYTLTDPSVPEGYQPFVSMVIQAAITADSNGYKLDKVTVWGTGNNGNTPNAYIAENNCITMQYFPVAKMYIKAVDENNDPLANVSFLLQDSSGHTIDTKLTTGTDGVCEAYVRLHENDNFGKNTPVLTVIGYPTCKLTLNAVPEGYQTGITCSFNLYYKEYPGVTPTPHYETGFYVNMFNGSHGIFGSYTADRDNDQFTLTVHVATKKTCTVTIRKVDDAGNPVNGVSAILQTSGGSIWPDVNNDGYKTQYLGINSKGSSSTAELARGAAYELADQGGGTSYTRAEKFTFTVGDETRKTVDIVVHDRRQTKSDFAVGNVTFLNANSWAYQLCNQGGTAATDNPIDLSGAAAYYWNGKLYYNFKALPGVSNTNRQQYSQSDAALNAAPDPVQHLESYLEGAHITDTASAYLVELTGRVLYTVNTAATLTRGDLVVAGDALYVYLGTKDTPMQEPSGTLFVKVPSGLYSLK